MTSSPFLKSDFYVSPEMVIEGNIHSSGSGVIAGVVNGDVEVSAKLTIEKTGKVYGKVKCRSLLVKGAIKGNIYCEEKLYTQKTAFITGNIFAAEVSIDKESIIKGVIAHLNDQQTELQKTNDESQPEKEKDIIIPIIIVPDEMKPDEPPESWF